MEQYLPLALVGVLCTIILIGTFNKGYQKDPGAAWWVVFAVVGLITLMRGYDVISNFNLLMLYGGMVTLNYVLTFLLAYFVYKDPAQSTIGENHLRSFGRKIQIEYVIPVYNEQGRINDCIQSILIAAQYVSEFAEVSIVIVNDASTDDTAQILRNFEELENVTVIHLLENGGKKNALTAGTYGGENWRKGIDKFRKRYGRPPKKGDYEEILNCLREVGCNPQKADFLFHTDSDSYIEEDFIFKMLIAFLSDDKIGAVSGHCDVWLVDGQSHTMITLMQIPWYYSQFRVRKASESSLNKVFCVSGPGAAFKEEAVIHLLPQWVDDLFGGRYYRGATDRMITYLVLKSGWKVVYSASARVKTVVPATNNEARRQWTRWKQNFWRMYLPIWQYAWRTNPLVAFLTYSRLLVTTLAPFILAYHMVSILLGGFMESALYLSGISLMGGLMALDYVSRNPSGWRFALLRPIMSIYSALWGSILSLRSLFMTSKGVFSWREGQNPPKKGRFLYHWFEPTFELRFLEAIVIVAIIIYVFQNLGKIIQIARGLGLMP